MFKTLIKNIVLLLVVASTLSVAAIVEVELQNNDLLPSPLPLLEENGEGKIVFEFREKLGIDDIPHLVNGIENTEIEITLTKLRVKGNDALNITGDILNYFTVTIDPDGTVFFQQKVDIPKGTIAGVVIPVEVTANSVITDNEKNGYIANLSCIDDTTTPDISQYTYTRSSNNPPVAVDDSGTTAQDTSVDVTVLINDADIDGNTLTVTGTTTPANGTVVVNADGTVTYTPNAGFSGTDTFDYTISDGNGGTATATVTITVTADENKLPIAIDDATTTTDATAIIMNVLANDTDEDNDMLSVVSTSTPANGAIVVNANGTITYTPEAGFVGTDTFDYTISDGNGGTATATVTITVSAEETPIAAPTVEITEDVNNDGSITETELDGDVDVTITLPTGVQVDDILTLSGSISDTISVTQEMIDTGYTFTVPAPAAGETVTVNATLTNATGNTSDEATDSATMADTVVVGTGNGKHHKHAKRHHGKRHHGKHHHAKRH